MVAAHAYARVGCKTGNVDEGLKAVLDSTQGGTIAQQFMDLYDYIGGRLLVANLRNDTGLLDQAARLLGELRGVWASLADRRVEAVALFR